MRRVTPGGPLAIGYRLAPRSSATAENATVDGLMRAVTYERVGTRPSLQRVPIPACPPDGALVRVEATGVCRSDWHAWRGHDPVPLPHTPGHEFAGTVAQIGSLIRDVAVGTRVTAPFVNGCGVCAWCLGGDAQVCPEQSQPGFSHPGSFADYVVVRAADFNLVPLPDAVDAVTAAALGCRFATAFRALTGHATVGPGTQVAVFGCGGVGLSVAMIAVALGARVTAVDLSAPALDRARELGAATTIRSADPVAQVVAATDGGAQVSVDALGSSGTADAAVRSLRRRGTHVQVGLMLGAAAAAPLPWDRLIAWELTVVGSHGMAAADYPPMLELVTSGRLRPGRLVGSVVGLAGAIDAMVA
ncbi:MAG TPA: alcohol dehydrogenase catalytic domain-containing protein, partial [Nakamurella sp.]